MAAEPWELHPYEGAGPLRFGMSHERVVALLGQPEMVIGRDPFLAEATGDVQTEYERHGRLVSIHTAGAPLAWRGILLTGRPVREVERDLQAAGIEIDGADPSGPVVPSLGIAIYAPDDDHYPNRGVQGVLVKSREYDTLDA